ncbi:organic solvent tolerance protein [Desulfonema ishimotonii]|uniref:Organic solvent tolerance protein n=2 Tax=Desulfonema ishimotonii TaxID=45657 RepID=A0A401FQU7_9BACT|nr:organic solvent tolerance protein [Desulfonema ishimotonii]
MLLWPLAAMSASVEEVFADDPGLPWEIKADDVEYDMENEVYVARDGVIISRGANRLSADFVRFDYRNMKASAEGHVVMTTGEDVLTGTRIDIDLGDETGTVHNGQIFIKENHFYIRGDRIEKVGRAEYMAYKASVTSCDGEKPDWKITGRNLNVTVEGYGTARHAALWFGPVPVIYTPFFIFPVKQKRQSGLLTPGFGTSDRRGEEYLQPFYWSVSDHADATFYNHYMTERGNKMGLEFRYVLDENSRGVLMYDFLDDKKVDDGTGDSSKNWGYTDDDELRPNEDRYWFRMKADQALPAGFTSRLDLDIVSDQDYLKEFKSGHSGFDTTKSAFERRFNREIDDYTDPIRANSLTVSQIRSAYSFNAQVLWYDNVVSRRWKDEDTTLSQLPFITLSTAKQSLGKTPLYWNLDTGYSYFYREDGERNQRIDINPRLYLPHRFGNHFFMEPSLGLRQTLWHVDRFGADDEEEDRNRHREMADFKLDLYTHLNRVYTLSADGGVLPDQVRHGLRPQLIYEYMPDQDQDDYPFADALDRIERKNRVTFSLVNTLTSKTRKAVTEGVKESPEDIYRQFCRFEVRQSYEFDSYDADETLAEYTLSDRTTPETGKHLSPLYGELSLTPSDFFSIEADAEWSHLDGDFRSRNVALSVWDRRGDSAFVEHRYTDELTESLYTSVTLKLSSRISAYGEYERNLLDDEDLKTGFGVWYTARCWSLNMTYTKEEEDRSYGFMINLNGLGGIGTN